MTDERGENFGLRQFQRVCLDPSSELDGRQMSSEACEPLAPEQANTSGKTLIGTPAKMMTIKSATISKSNKTTLSRPTRLLDPVSPRKDNNSSNRENNEGILATKNLPTKPIEHKSNESYSQYKQQNGRKEEEEKEEEEEEKEKSRQSGATKVAGHEKHPLDAASLISKLFFG